MTDRDVLLVHVAAASPGGTGEIDSSPADDVWELRAGGRPPRQLQPFTEALDEAMKWAAELGGKIYRQKDANEAPELYTPTG